MIMDKLAKLSTAEEFFETLAVPFDLQVVNVHRLHILKTFREKLRRLGPDAGESQCREALEQAYGEFAQGVGRKTFKVFKDANPGFVSISDIRR